MDPRVMFLGSRCLVEDAARGGRLEDCLIAGCDLSGMEFNGFYGDRARLRELNAPRMVFRDSALSSVSFFSCRLAGMEFVSSVLEDGAFDASVLIRGRFRGSKLKNLRLRGSCLQKAEFSRMRVVSSSFADFEALESRVEGCVFSGCLFTLSYGSGMNGFSGSLVKNCIFSGCRFEGFPFQGALLDNCLFLRSSGQPGGEEAPRTVKTSPCVRAEEARAILKSMSA